MKKIAMLAILASLGFGATAQVSHGGTPLFNHSGTKVTAPTHTLPTVDSKRLIDEDVRQERMGNPMRVGVMQYEDIDIVKEATTVKNASGTHYVLAVSSPDAKAIGLHFSEFDLPEGAELFIYDESGDFVLGSYRADDVMSDGTFYTQSIPGSTVFVEYNVPAGADPGRLVIDNVCHRYKEYSMNRGADSDPDIKGPHGSAQSNCHPNVICPEGDGWRNEIRSVVALELRVSYYAYMCSGTVINNARQDRTPYVLSANHCQSQGSISQIICYFLYETNACQGTVGVSNKSMTGATTLAKIDENDGSDFWLMRLNSAIPDDYRPYYAGWNNQDATPDEGICIHHPGGDYKKLSIPQQVMSRTGAYRNFWVVRWMQENTIGVTEEGSSGSGLFDASHHLVGTLTGGYSYCNDPSGLDYYGRFDVSWNNSNDSTKSVRHWLDPDNTGITTLDGLNYSEVGIDNVPESYRELTVYPNPSNGTVHFDVDAIGDANYKVFDMSGRCVLEGSTVLTVASQALNLNQLASGIYVLQLHTAGGSYTSKLNIRK